MKIKYLICMLFLSLSSLGDTYHFKNGIGWESTGISVNYGDTVKIVWEDGAIYPNHNSFRSNSGIAAKTGNLIGGVGEWVFDVGNFIIFQSNCSGILKLRRNFAKSPNGNTTVAIYIKRNDVKIDVPNFQDDHKEDYRKKSLTIIANIVKEEHTRLLKIRVSKGRSMMSEMKNLETSVKNENRKAYISGDKTLFYSLRNKRDKLERSIYTERRIVQSLKKNNDLLVKQDLLAGVWFCVYDIKRHLSSSKTHKLFQYNYVTKFQSIDESSILGKGDGKTLVHLKGAKSLDSLPDEDVLLTVMVRDGVFQYSNVLGAKKTIPSYICLLALSRDNISSLRN
jgi:hypothetical protein